MRFLIFLLLSFSLFAQTGSQIKDTVYIKQILNKAKKNVQSNNTSTSSLCREAIDLSTILNYNTGIYRANNILGILNFYKGNHQMSIEYYKKSMKIAQEQLKDSCLVGKSHLNTGISHDLLGDHHEAIQEYLLALNYLSNKNIEVKITTYQAIGGLYGDLELPEKAIHYYKIALQLCLDYQKENMEASISLSLGEIHQQNGKLDQAFSIYKNIKPVIEKIDDYTLKFLLYDQLSKYYLDKNKTKQALTYAKKALFLEENYNLNGVRPRIYKQLGDIYIKKEELTIAKTKYNEAIESSQKMGLIEIEKETYLALSRVFKKEKNFKQAFIYLNKSKTINDSIRSERNIKTINSFTTKFENKKKDALLASKDLQMQKLATKSVKKQRLTILISSFIIVLGLIAWTLFLKMRNKTLKQARLEALKASEAKSKFLDTMTHELLTPLHTISGSTYLLQNATENDLKDEHLKAISFSVDYLKNLIDNSIILNTLNDTALKHNVIKSGSTSFSVHTLLKEVCKTIPFKTKNNTIKFDLDNTVPYQLFGPKHNLTRILINLLNNANRFTKNGFIIIRLTGQQNTTKNWKITFLVKDTGIGISKDEQTKVFNEFYTGIDHRNDQYIGMGLGLHLVHKILSLYNVKPKLESIFGIGTSISFSLNFDISNKLETGINGKKNKLLKPKILLAEDNKINQKISQKILKNLGYDCDIAENGQIAVDMYKKANYPLVLMDIMMPIMNGFEAALKIHQFDKKAKIIALTAICKEEHEDEFSKAFINDVLSKPIHIESLKKVLEKLLLV